MSLSYALLALLVFALYLLSHLVSVESDHFAEVAVYNRREHNHCSVEKDYEEEVVGVFVFAFGLVDGDVAEHVQREEQQVHRKQHVLQNHSHIPYLVVLMSPFVNGSVL